MNLRPAFIPAAMTVSFVLASGVFWWNRKREESALAPASAAMPAPRAVPGQATRFIPSTAPASQAVPASPAVLAPARGVAEAANDEDVPVNFKIRQAKGGGQMVLVQNQSGAPISVVVTATNPASGSVSMAQAAIDPSRNMNFTDLGLVVLPGDHITITSPPYRDQSFDAQ